MADAPDRGRDAGATRCGRCGAEFVCGALAGSKTCWCAELPALAPEPGGTCLCPACLKQATRGPPGQ